MVRGGSTHVCDQESRDNQPGQCKAVADLLQQDAGGAQGRRGDIGATVIVHNNTDRDISDCDDGLADNQRFCVLPWVAHLGDDGEEGWRACISKDKRRAGRDRFGEGWIVCDFVVRHEGAILRCSSRAILDTNRDSDSEYWTGISEDSVKS